MRNAIRLATVCIVFVACIWSATKLLDSVHSSVNTRGVYACAK